MKKLLAILWALFVGGCDAANTSDTSADYATLRVRELVLTDSRGKPAVLVTAERGTSGATSITFRSPGGVVLKSIELEAR